jgi:hypothetical protein
MRKNCAPSNHSPGRNFGRGRQKKGTKTRKKEEEKVNNLNQHHENLSHSVYSRKRRKERKTERKEERKNYCQTKDKPAIWWSTRRERAGMFVRDETYKMVGELFVHENVHKEQPPRFQPRGNIAHQ